MSKSCWFAFVLAVICLSLEADAQPTVDETITCGSSTLEDVAKVIRDTHKDVKKLLASNQECECDTAIDPSKQPLVSALESNCVPLLIQQNVNGSDFFNRSWAEFKVGFNDSIGNYWLGNELLSQLTANDRYKLKFDLQSRSNTSNWYWAEYSTFRVLTEADNYRLQVAGYSGNAGYDAFSYQNGMVFTTHDRDNDRVSSYNCAAYHGGGFWYKACFACGVNCSTGYFFWSGLPGGLHLQSSRMWLQCKQ